MTAKTAIQQTLGPITFRVLELPADFYGDRFYVQGERKAGRHGGRLTWFCGSYWRTYEQAETSRAAWQAETDTKDASEPVALALIATIKATLNYQAP